MDLHEGMINSRPEPNNKSYLQWMREQIYEKQKTITEQDRTIDEQGQTINHSFW